MTATTIACLLLIGGGPPPTSVTPTGDPSTPAPTPPYEVMQIRSGTELGLKINGTPTTVRLLGVAIPRVSPDTRVDRLSQMNFLRQLIPVGSRVSITTEGGPRRFQVALSASHTP